MPGMANVLTSREAAERCGIPLRTWHNWVLAGHIDPVRKLDGIRGALLFDADEVERLAETHAAEVAS